MPSDERVRGALAPLARGRETFRAAVGEALDQIRGYLATHAAAGGDRAALAAAELGSFAGGRIDGGRFAALVSASRLLEGETEAAVRRCADALASLLDRGDALFACEVPAGGDLREVVAAALADAGRAFGAALAFQALRTGVYRGEQHEPLLHAFPFARWNRGERLLAPPLVIEVDGADLRAGALAEFLDGRQQLVLLVRGACTPAPLVRLVTPGIFVLQAAAETELEALAAFDGPGVAALVPTPAAHFAHDPLGGSARGRLLTITHVPPEPPRTAVGGWSVWQQREELAQLVALDVSLAAPAVAPPPATDAPPVAHAAAAPDATVPPATAAPVAAPVAAPPAAPLAATATPASGDGLAVRVLADWLLAQAGLPAAAPTDPGTGPGAPS